MKPKVEYAAIGTYVLLGVTAGAVAILKAVEYVNYWIKKPSERGF